MGNRHIFRGPKAGENKALCGRGEHEFYRAEGFVDDIQQATCEKCLDRQWQRELDALGYQLSRPAAPRLGQRSTYVVTAGDTIVGGISLPHGWGKLWVDYDALWKRLTFGTQEVTGLHPRWNFTKHGAALAIALAHKQGLAKSADVLRAEEEEKRRRYIEMATAAEHAMEMEAQNRKRVASAIEHLLTRTDLDLSDEDRADLWSAVDYLKERN